MARVLGSVFLALALVIAAVPAGAVALADGKLMVNGYGNWYYAKSDGNTYLSDEDGDWGNSEVTLSFIGLPTSDVSIHIQPFWEMTDEGVETEVDIAFGEYGFSDALNLRFGIARHPFGIYTPIYDAGILRPFMTLPSGLYSESAGIIAESYAGIALHGNFNFAAGWGLEYDLYGGALEIGSTQPWEEEVAEETELEDLVGGKLVVHTGIEGLNFGGSVYSGKVTDEVEGGAIEDHRNLSLGGQVEYLTERITFRAEYAMQSIKEESDTQAAYAEAGFMAAKRLQVAARWDWQNVSLADEEIERIGGEPDSALVKHNEVALGVNWWFSQNLVVKLSYHLVNGLRFAAPGEDAGEEVDRKTRTILFGASFGF